MIEFGQDKQIQKANFLKIEYSSLAQSVEHAAVNRRVVGSSPTGGAKNSLSGIFLFSN